MRSGSQLLLAAAAFFAAGSACFGQNNTNEVEPNDTKATATVVAAMENGDTITGSCTGATTTAGATSVDFWDITTTGAGTPGIYMYTLTIDDVAKGYTGSTGPFYACACARTGSAC